MGIQSMEGINHQEEVPLRHTSKERIPIGPRNNRNSSKMHLCRSNTCKMRVSEQKFKKLHNRPRDWSSRFSARPRLKKARKLLSVRRVSKVKIAQLGMEARWMVSHTSAEKEASRRLSMIPARLKLQLPKK